MVLLQVFCLHQDVVNDEAVCDVVHQAHPKHPDYQLEKLVVILFTDAVVEVPAVMIEARGAPVALATVLGACQHMSITNLAVILVLGGVEGDLLLLACLLQNYSGVLGIAGRACVPIVSCT
jgi:hypothetical protein